MKYVVLKSGKYYRLSDFNSDIITKNESLISELDMKTLPETFVRILGLHNESLYKPILIKKIEMYDKSEQINSFIYNGNTLWFDKNTRMGLMHLANCSLDTMQLVIGGEVIILQVDEVKQFLKDLEIYASKCYLLTLKHIKAVSELSNTGDIINYDYTIGYPEKIILK